MEAQHDTWPLWRAALTSWPVWRRSLLIGLCIGFLQIAVNQGDVWWRLQISSTLICKTLATPLIATSVALFSSAGAYVDVTRGKISTGEPEGVGPRTASLSSGT